MTSPRWFRAVLLCVCAFVCLPIAAARAANTCTSHTYQGAPESSWSVASTWANCGGGVPGPGDTAVIAAGYPVYLAANTTVGSVTVADGATLDLEGSSLTAGSATVGASPSAVGATLRSFGGAGTLTVSGALSIGRATIGDGHGAVNLDASGATTFAAPGASSTAASYTSTWTGSSFTQTGGSVAFNGPYVLSGVNPSISAPVSVTGQSSVTGTATLIGPSTVTFHPSAASPSTTSASMLTLGGLQTSGTVSVTSSFDQGYTPATGDEVNLLASPTGLIGLSTTNSQTQSYTAASTATELVFKATPALPSPTVSLSGPGGETPAAPKIGQQFTVPITSTGASTITCTQDGTVLPAADCTPTTATLTAPNAATTSLTVTATNASGSASATSTYGIPWLPSTLTASPPQGNDDIGLVTYTMAAGVPAGTVDCAATPFSLTTGSSTEVLGLGSSPAGLFFDSGDSETRTASANSLT